MINGGNRSILSLNNFSILVDGLDHPECVAWGRDGYLYAGGEAGQIYRISLSGEVNQLASTGGSLLGICLDGSNNVYACDFKHQAVMRIDPEGEVRLYSDGSPDRKMKLPNYAVFDDAGNLYVSDSGGWHENNGCLFRIAPGGTTSVVSTETAAFPNGLALHPDGCSLYIVLSNLPGVVRLTLNADGTVGPAQKVVELPRAVPDGLAFDSEGGLYISCYTPDIIYRFSTEGLLEILVQDEERTLIASPTNLVFAGPDLSQLVAANYGCWHLVGAKAPIRGAAGRYPLLSN